MTSRILKYVWNCYKHIKCSKMLSSHTFSIKGWRHVIILSSLKLLEIIRKNITLVSEFGISD